MISICKACFFTFLLILGCRGTAQTISSKSIKKHVSFLASDKLKGRGTGSGDDLIAAEYISKQFRSYKLQALKGSYTRSFTFKKSLNPHDSSVAAVPERTSVNVIGFLDNGAKNTIVIGGHYDHLGLGHDHNSLDANPDGKIHNGADDNASGTAGVLALAEYFTGNKVKESCNFLFMCFSGEELGLIGSKKWCDNPDIPLQDISYMINMDMIGRLNDSTHKLVVYGVGTSPAFVPILDSIRSKLSVKKDSSGIGPSDQTSFYLKDIPVLHFFTGQHSDYHKPSDDEKKINYTGEVEVLEYIVEVINHTLHYPKLIFAKTRNPESSKVSFKVTMGVMPDYTFEGEGMRIDGVTDNKPAARAGIQKGDVVVRLGGTPVKDVQTYMKVLSNFKKGDSTKVEVSRAGRIVVLDLTF